MNRYEDTNFIIDKIERAESIQELKSEVLDKLSNAKDMWIKKINQIIEENQYQKTEFANLCGVSRTAVNKWINGAIPQKRDIFIKIGFAAHYNLQEMNSFLTRYGRYPELYAKSLEDSICIFVLNSGKIHKTYDSVEKILNKVRDSMGMGEKKTEIYDTIYYENKIIQIDSDTELVDFICENAIMFSQNFKKLYAYIKAFLMANRLDEMLQENHSISYLAEDQKWSSSLKKCVSNINQNKWYPKRDKLISLGLHLNMDTNQINTMLKLAYMEPLYAKNIFESVIIFGLENASLENIIFQDGTNSLCEYVQEIFAELNLPELGFFMDEFPNE